MAKIIVIDYGEGHPDWVIMPEGWDIAVAWKQYQEWGAKEYVKGERGRTFEEWLLERGARKPTSEELEIFDVPL